MEDPKQSKSDGDGGGGGGAVKEEKKKQERESPTHIIMSLLGAPATWVIKDT